MAKPAPQKKTKPAPAKTKAPVVLENLIPENFAKKIFLVLSIVLVIAMAYLSKDYGITGDENFHRTYGHHVWHFYTSFGEDKTCTLPYGNPDSLMMYYGGFYDGTAAALSETFPRANEFRLRHFWNSLFASAAMILAGLVAVEIAGWQAGLLVLLFMIFSPRFFGEGMNNPKDITMATGYVLSYLFILKFLKQLPKPKISVAIGLGVAIGIALGIRIGGLLLIPYLFLFYGIALVQRYGFSELFNFSKFRENILPSFKYVLLAAFLGFGLGMLFWPYGLISPISHSLETLGVSSKFPATISMLFDGKQIVSTEIPWYYIPKWISITTPLFGLIGLLASVFLIQHMRSEGKFLLFGFIVFTLVFPVFYIIYKKAVLYDGMRHMYFVYPSIIILAGLSFDYFIKRMQKPLKFAVAGLALVLLLLPARFMFANHPNQAVYFNEAEGGIKSAYGNYETDYYMNSVKQCADWIHEHEKLEKRNGEKISVRSNAVAPCNFYFKDDTANVSVGYVSYRNRSNVSTDYLIMYCRYVDRELLLSGAFPPEQTVFVAEADGVPLSCVIRKDDKGDMLGMDAIQKNDFENAIRYLEPYCTKYPKAESAMTNLALAYLQTVRTDPSRLQKAVNVLNAALQFNQQNMNAIYYLSAAYEMSGNTTEAQILKNRLQQLQSGN